MGNFQEAFNSRMFAEYFVRVGMSLSLQKVKMAPTLQGTVFQLRGF